MTKTLVIAEKPSVAQDIVRALTPVAGKFDSTMNISRASTM
jgi:DNA topoisomerase-3